MSFTKKLSGPIVGFNSLHGKIIGDALSALLFAQFSWWSHLAESDDGWFDRTQAEIEDITCMTRRQQETARAVLDKLGIVETKRKGVPLRNFYRVNFQLMDEMVLSYKPMPHVNAKPKESVTSESCPQQATYPPIPSTDQPCQPHISDSLIEVRFKDLSLSETAEKNSIKNLCASLKLKGISGANPLNAELLSLLNDGVSTDHILEIANEAVEKDKKSLGWIMATIKGRMEDARKLSEKPKAESKPSKPSPTHASHIEVQPEPVKRIKSVMPDHVSQELAKFSMLGKL